MGHKFPNVTVFKRWGWVYVLSVCLGFAMPFYWGFPYFFTLVLFGISALTQFVFFLFIFRGFNAPIGLFIKNVSQSVKLLFYTVLSSLLLKLVLQIFATIPTLASAARWNVHFTVGFIHLILLGVVSSLLLFFVLMNQYISKKLKWCIAIFVWTFAATETLLFTNGIMILMNVHLSWNFNLFMFLASIGFPMTIFGISIFMNYRETSLNSQFKG